MRVGLGKRSGRDREMLINADLVKGAVSFGDEAEEPP